MEHTRQFPKNKYNFTEHLRNIGDSVTTYPLDYDDYRKILDAAKFWAWKHECRVKCRSFRTNDMKYEVTVTLISKHRYK